MTSDEPWKRGGRDGAKIPNEMFLDTKASAQVPSPASPRCAHVHVSRASQPVCAVQVTNLVQTLVLSNTKTLPTALFLFSKRGKPAPKVSVRPWLVVCPGENFM